MAFSFSKIHTYLPLLTVTYFYTNKQTNRKLTFATNAYILEVGMSYSVIDGLVDLSTRVGQTIAYI